MAPRESSDQHFQQCHIRSQRSLSPPKVVMETKAALKKHAARMAKRADEHEQFINKIMYLCGVLSFGTFCFLLGSRPQDIPSLYCLFFIVVAPLRWIYYRSKKWHYYLLDFCYYANVIFMIMILYFPDNEKLFMVCFSFSEGPLAWALIVWRCSLVFSSFDKIVSVLIHLLPGTVFFIIRWWDPATFPRHSMDDTGPWPAWPVVNNLVAEWTWLFFVPLLAYCVWQALYFLIVEGLRRQRLLNDPEVMTSYREMKRKAERANNIWWRLSGLLGDERRVIMYAVIQAAFTLATLALTVLLFKSYHLHTLFEIFKLSATVWNGGNYVFDVMPRQVAAKGKKHGINQAKAANGPSVLGVVEGPDCNGSVRVENGMVSGSGLNASCKPSFCDSCRKSRVEDLSLTPLLDSVHPSTAGNSSTGHIKS